MDYTRGPCDAMMCMAYYVRDVNTRRIHVDKKITLTGNVESDKLEIEIWDGCLVFTAYETTADDDCAGVVVLLVKEQVDELKAHVDKYYETLTTFHMHNTDRVMYGTRETE